MYTCMYVYCTSWVDIYMYIIYIHVYHVFVHVLMRDEKEGRSKQDQTNNKAKQHSTPKAVNFA